MAAVALLGLGTGSRIVDVGSGASTLVDSLVTLGFRSIAVLDVAESALKIAQARLGARSTGVEWTVADVTNWSPTMQFDLWHDRAVFHFLTHKAQREAYKTALLAALRPGGWLIMATFAEDGPEHCSGLEVTCWSASRLAAEIGPGLQLVHQDRETHKTPGRLSQAFTWMLFQRAKGKR